MNIGVVAPQSSRWRDEFRAAVLLVKGFLKAGHKAWLITSVYHDDAPALDESLVERSLVGFVERHVDPSGVPTLRVLSARSIRGVSFRSFVKVLREIDAAYGLDVLVVFSSFWNGPEEAARWVGVKRSLAAAGEEVRPTFFVYVPMYYIPRGINPVERAARIIWGVSTLPYVLSVSDLVLAYDEGELNELGPAARGKSAAAPYWLDDEMAELVDKCGDVDVGNLVGRGVEHLVLSVGYLKEKALESFIKLANMFVGRGNVAFVGVGGAERRVRAPGNVSFFEDLPDDRLACLYKAAVACVDFSAEEPVGARVFECMYGGTPVVISPHNRAARFVRNGVDGVHLAGVDDVQGAASAIRAFLGNRALRGEMARNAKERAAAHRISRTVELILSRLGGLFRG